MDSIFHEKQEGSLCAQHCLNSLLQGPYFTAVDLSIWAEKLDEEERVRMAECGEESEEYKNFLKQPSGNMDDSGYFSIQVISSALQVWGLELVPFTSTDVRVKDCVTEPCRMQAFICNYQSHWFTIRKIGGQWFNLNSLLAKPVFITDTYLSLFLAQLKKEGYSIFVVFGDLPPCTADEVIRSNPIHLSPQRSTPPLYEDDPELQAAINLSLSQEFTPPSANSEDDDLQRALMLSLSCESSEEDDHIRKALLLSMSN